MPLFYSPLGLSLNINGSAGFPQATYKRSCPTARQILFLTGVSVLSVSYERSSLPYPPFFDRFIYAVFATLTTHRANQYTYIHSLFTL
jgi:hypothetical protein